MLYLGDRRTIVKHSEPGKRLVAMLKQRGVDKQEF